MDAVRIVEDEVRELIRRRGLDPLRQAGEVRRLVEAAVSDYDERALMGPLAPIGPLETARRFVFDAVAGFGALQPLLDDPAIEEIWINAPNGNLRGAERRIRADVPQPHGPAGPGSGGAHAEEFGPAPGHVLALRGRRACPTVPRLHVVIPDVTRRHWAINIRKFVVKASRLEHLVELGTLTPQSARFLGAAVASGLNILVSGATQAGKTTMLNCLCRQHRQPRARHHRRGNLRAAVSAAGRRRAAMPAAQPGRRGRNPAAPAGQGSPPDAARPTGGGRSHGRRRAWTC